MKLENIRTVQETAAQRRRCIEMHRALSDFGTGSVNVSVGGVSLPIGAVTPLYPYLLAGLRAHIESLEADLRALGVEITPHFAAHEPPEPADPHNLVTVHLAARGYTLVGTGGGCTAWARTVTHVDHNEQIVITDVGGAFDPTEQDWLICVYPTDDEWLDSRYTVSTEDEGADKTYDGFVAALDRAEAIARKGTR